MRVYAGVTRLYAKGVWLYANTERLYYRGAPLYALVLGVAGFAISSANQTVLLCKCDLICTKFQVK